MLGVEPVLVCRVARKLPSLSGLSAWACWASRGPGEGVYLGGGPVWMGFCRAETPTLAPRLFSVRFCPQPLKGTTQKPLGHIQFPQHPDTLVPPTPVLTAWTREEAGA